MSSVTSAQKREAYRERLYLHYLTNHRPAILSEARESLRKTNPYFKRVLRHIPKERSTRVLDLGCGYGHWLHWLNQAGYHDLEGIERSVELVRTAHSLGLDFVKEGDISIHLNKRETQSCDAVLALNVLEHFAKDEAMAFVDEVFRVLTPGGVFILHMPNGEGIFSGSVAHGDFTHELLVTSGSLRQILLCAGFSEIRSYEDTPIVHGLKSAIRFLIWKAARTVGRLVYAAETGNIGRELILTQNFLTVARKP
jgi:SAM-dependent methyltransferase